MTSAMSLSGNTRASHTRAWSLAVGVLGTLLSLGRLWLADRSAPQEVLWAEDGLFPLCIDKADFWSCLVDPFAGYFLFLPRVLAWPISLMPWESWAFASNLVAALLAGIVGAFAFVIARHAGLTWFSSVVIGLLPVLAPVSGLEAINALGSSYMLLLYLSTIVIALPSSASRDARSRTPAVAGACLLLVTALTIPSAVVLIVVIGIMWVRAAISSSRALLWSVATGAGLAAQAIIALGASNPRPLALSGSTLSSWVESIPISLLTYWPGLNLNQYSFFTNFTLSPTVITPWLVTGALIAAGVILITRMNPRALSAGALIVSGLGLGLIPTAIGYANNRYFVVPLLLWGAAALVLLDSRISRTPAWVLTLVSVIVLIVWWPAMAASTYRATPAPPWSSEVARIEAKCKSDPSFIDRPLFTPFWPPNWGDGLSDPTHPNLPCTLVWRWLP